MTLGGWINLFLSLGFVLGLLGWCLWRLLTASDTTDPTPGELANIAPVREGEDAPPRARD